MIFSFPNLTTHSSPIIDYGLAVGAICAVGDFTNEKKPGRWLDRSGRVFTKER